MQEEKRESTAIVVKLYGQRVPPFQKKSLSWSQESEQIATYCKWDFPDLTEFEFLT